MKIFAIIALAMPVTIASAEPAKSDHSSKILPTFKLDLNEGKTKLKAGASFTWARGEEHDLMFDAAYQTSTSEGVSRLVTLSEDGAASSDYQLGGALTLTVLRSQLALPPETTNRTRIAFTRCLASCASADTKNKTFCDRAEQARKAMQPPPDSVDKLTSEQVYALLEEMRITNPEVELCPEGADFISSTPTSLRDAVAVIPRVTLSGGALVGRNRFEYLRRDPDSMILLPDNESKRSLTGILVGNYVTDDLLTFEASLKLQSRAVAEGKKVRWCIPEGMVVDGGVEAPTEACSERILGEPKRHRAIEFAAYFGTVSASRSTRVSAGFFTTREPTDAAADRRVYGLRFPVLLSTDILPGQGIYKGVLRITPTLSFSESGGSKDDVESQFFVLLEVFTSRSLFGTATDIF